MKFFQWKVVILFGLSLLFAKSIQADNLSYGIYWYGKDNTYVKHVPGQYNKNFNKYKKTVIFAHGWQSGAMERGTHESFNYKRMSAKFLDKNTADAWIADGWNIGIFYWREWADEPWVVDAESKVWSPFGLRGMRMRDTNGNFHPAPTDIKQKKSVSDLFYEAYASAMQGYRGNNIRLAGHSLGNQLVIATTDKINKSVNSGKFSQNLRPERIALLDPFYSNLPKPFWLGKTVGQRSYEILTMLRNDGISIEYYQNSAVDALGTIMGTVFDNNSASKIKSISAYQNMRPWYLAAWELGEKHLSGPYMYFLSYDLKVVDINGNPVLDRYGNQLIETPPDEVTLGAWVGPWWARYYDPLKRVDTGKDALSARTSDSRVRDMMYNPYYWDQVEGRYTNITTDDQFQRKRK